MSASDTPRRLTVTDIAKRYADGERLPMLTAYDYPTAQIIDDAGVPLILVGDSVGQVMLGYESTVRVTMAEMLHHTKAVVRGTRQALIIGDMPFLTYSSSQEALENAGRFLQEAGAQAVKVEGGVRSARIIDAMVRAGIPVMGHIGWTPQAQHGMGGKVKVQGKDRTQARALLADALAVQEAGAFSIVLELMPAQLAGAITDRLNIQRPGPGRHRPARSRRFHAAPRTALREPAEDDRRCGARLRCGCGRGLVPGRRRDGAHGRRGSRRCAWPGCLGPGDRRGTGGRHPPRPRPLIPETPRHNGAR